MVRLRVTGIVYDDQSHACRNAIVAIGRTGVDGAGYPRDGVKDQWMYGSAAETPRKNA